MAKHNKKRNVGLLHEQLVRHASQMTVEGKAKDAERALSILTESFCEGSELLKEFRLFSALVHPRIEDIEVAKRIVRESRVACANHDPHKLDKEKSALIRKINHEIDRKDFYNQRVENYKVFSTIQALLNEWRGRSHLSASERVQYEVVLEQHLNRKNPIQELSTKDNANPLVFNIMIEKFNQKYGDRLTQQQHRILKSRLLGDNDSVVKQSNLIRLEAKAAVEKFYEDCDNKVLNEKRDHLLTKINGYTPDTTDESVAKALMLSDLIQELED